MKAVNKAGFTIIETMLFLGITGLLAMGILVGTGSSLNTQRYRDSVNSLKTMLQQQYSAVSDVSNDNDSNSCNGSDNIPRGQSNCVILGRYITTTDASGAKNNNTLSVRQVIGYTNGLISDKGDIETLKQYQLSLSSINEIYNLDWGVSAVTEKNSQGGHQNLNFSILIVRSPSSGSIRTFTNANSVINASDISNSLLTLDAINTSVNICLDSSGLFTGPTMSVFLNANSTSASGVETKGSNSGC